MEANNPLPVAVDDQYHLTLRLFEKNDIVWVDDDADPDAPLDVTRKRPRLVSELDVTLSRADSTDSKRPISDALSAMNIRKRKQSMMIPVILTLLKESQSAGGAVALVKEKTVKRRRVEPYVCVTVERYKSELDAARGLGMEVGGVTWCAICGDDFEAGENERDRIVHLPCSHLFHVRCIDKCLEDEPSCPLCHFPLRRGFAQKLFM